MTSGDAQRVADAADDFWGFRGRRKELNSATGVYRVIVYDAFRATFTPSEGVVRVEVEGLAPEPKSFAEQAARVDELTPLLARLDNTFRAALPAAYLEATEANVTRLTEAFSATAGRRISPVERRELFGSQRPQSTEPPGPVITLDDVPELIVNFFGDRVTQVKAHNDEVTATLDHSVEISVGRDGQHGVFAAAITLAPGAHVSNVFGERLIARHSDARSIQELLHLMDYWYQLRTDGDVPAGLTHES